MDWQKLLEILIAFFTGAGISAAVTFRVTKKKYSNVSSSVVNQSGNAAGGDIIGGDKNQH